MSYKVCSRCQFAVPDKRKICTTCGGKMAPVSVSKSTATLPADSNPVRSAALREKLSLAEEQLPVLWWMKTVTRVKKAFDI